MAVFLHRILISVMFALCALIVPAHADTNNDCAALQAVLHTRYPDVENWVVAQVHAVRTKRVPQWFAQPESDVTIYRDGNLFAVRSHEAAVRHYRVKANRRVLVTTAFASKGNSLKNVSTTFESRDLFVSSCEFITDDFLSGDFQAWRLRRDIHSREAVCRNDIEPVPLVSKHDPLTLVCTRGQVTVTASVKAMTEGGLGKVIKVRRESNHMMVMARVTGRGEVNACI